MEQPPSDIQQNLRSYLQRLSQIVDLILQSRDTPIKYTALPARPLVGRVYYFSNADGAVTSEGYWGYTSAGWVKLG